MRALAKIIYVYLAILSLIVTSKPECTIFENTYLFSNFSKIQPFENFPLYSIVFTML